MRVTWPWHMYLYTFLTVAGQFGLISAARKVLTQVVIVAYYYNNYVKCSGAVEIHTGIAKS